jgi:DNA polymerase-1
MPLIRMDGQEADDVLASLARWSEGKAEDVLVATSDKDLYQIVDARVRLITPATEDRPMGREDVFAKTGVYPDHIVEWLALTGDAVDNIPGIRGLGPKTAARLLTTYGGLDALWKRLDEIEPERLRRSLAENRALVERNVGLVRLRTSIECAPDWEAMRIRPETPENMRPFYERMEFHSLLKTLAQPELL